jgi:predicted phosphodiesterase
MPALVIEKRKTPDGGTVLYFPFIAISDFHLGNLGYCRSKELSRMFHFTETDEMMLVGDVIDGMKLISRPTWEFDQWDRQVIAHILRKTGQGTKTTYLLGNHEEELRGEVSKNKSYGRLRNMVNKEIFGIKILNETNYTDANGHKFLVLHGDMESEKQNDPGFHGIICGHTHRDGFFKDEAGKRIINCGGCTGKEPVSAAVQDRNGTWAIIKWKRKGLFVRE